MNYSPLMSVWCQTFINDTIKNHYHSPTHNNKYAFKIQFLSNDSMVN